MSPEKDNIRTVQQLSESIARSALQSDTEPTQASAPGSEGARMNVGVDVIATLSLAKMIAETVATIVSSCPKSPTAAVVRSMRSPSWMQQVKFRAALATQYAGMRADERLRAENAADEAIAAARNLSVEEATAVVNELRAPMIDNAI